MFYEGALIITAAASLLLNIFQFGFLRRWRRKAIFWRQQFYRMAEPIEPPVLMADPYAKVKDELEYDWEAGWD